MSLEGRIIEFLDSDDLRIGYVRKQERDRLHIIDPRGRNLSVNSDRVVIVHGLTAESEFPSVARQISERIAVRQSEVDVELIWQSLGRKDHEVESGELAQLFFGENSAEAASAVFRAVSEDGLFFRRKSSHLVPKTEDQVSAELTRRQRQREREEHREHLTHLIGQLINSKTNPAPLESEPILDRIESWLLHKNGNEVSTILEGVVGPAKAREAAYEILVRRGRTDPTRDRFLVMSGIAEHFPQECIDAAAELASYSHEPSRMDYRDAEPFSIDDESTLEVDDALSISHSGNDTIVGIHIADVSAFIAKGNVLDTEASRRFSTIYLPSTRVRMFPERLSTDLVSFNAGVDRPSFTVEVRFDKAGSRLGYRIALTTIQVRKRLSYTEADKAIEQGDAELGTLHYLATQLHTARTANGAVTLRRQELKIHVENGEIEVQKINPDSPSRFLISEMMILANGLAADFASINKLPVIYRTQEPRDLMATPDAPLPQALAFDRLRRTFKRSRLSLSPGPHSGLGLSAYTQASSPIRRYADLITQRQFTSFLKGGPLPHGREELLKILTSAEIAEQEVRAIEDRSNNYWLLEYLSRYRKAEVFPAIVLDAKGNIELQDYFLRSKLVMPSTHQPGDIIEVRVESIDPAKGDARFRMAS